MLAALAACAIGFRADVSRFQSQLPAPQGQTFAVVADDPALAGGLEFAQYADLVDAQMAKLGYRETAPSNADLLVRFDYGIDNGRERLEAASAAIRSGRRGTAIAATVRPFTGRARGASAGTTRSSTTISTR